MDQTTIVALNKIACQAALSAGAAILEIYRSDNFESTIKSDHSPLTLADKKAHTLISEKLNTTKFPILSEEGQQVDYETRRYWQSFWMVDPLDGTKEFIKRNGEFTVNIALIHKNYPILGVIYAPVLDTLYWGFGKNVFCKKAQQAPIAITAIPLPANNEDIKLVGSRSHLNEATRAYMATFASPRLKSMGSSLKFMLIAQGDAHIYPRLAPTMEWDTAAAQAIVEAAGGRVYKHDTGERMYYNKPNLLNPHFIAKGKVTRG